MNILVINLGWEQEPLIQKLSSKNVNLYGIHNDNSYIRSVNFKEIKICDFRDLETILNFAKDKKIDGVISDNCDYSLLAQSFIASILTLPAPSLKAGQISNNKYLQRTITQDLGIKSPKFKLCLERKDVEDFGEKYGFPIITKPVDNRGSFGVKKINSSNEIEEAFNYALLNSNSNLVLVEEFIDGKQITIDGYGFPKNGIRSLTIGDKNLVCEDGEVATTISYPSQLPANIQEKAILLNEKINSAFGYNFGMTHSEYMIKDDEVYLIESTNRGGGVFTSSLIAPYSCGIDLIEQYVSDVMAVEKDLYKKQEYKKVVLKFFRFESGVVQDIVGFDTILKDPQVIKAKLNIIKYDIIKNITNDANRHGFMIYMGSNEEAEKVMSEVKVVKG